MHRSLWPIRRSQLVDHVLDVFFGVAVVFLNLAFDLVGFAFALQAFIARQLAGGFLEFALALLNSAFNLVFCSCQSFFVGEKNIGWFF